MSIATQIVRLKTKIDEAFAFAEGLPPAVIPRFTVEGDNFQIGPVCECDQRIVAADRVLAARNHRKPELPIIPDCLIEIIDDNDQVINALNHG